MDSSAEYSLRSDEELVLLLAKRDTAALEAVSRRYSRLAYSLALRILGDPGWAEEVVQDVLLRLWRRPEMFDPARGDLRRWLLRVTHNAAIAGLRGRRGTARARDSGPEELAVLPHRGDDPAEAAWKSLQAEAVRAALAELPSAQRQAVELAYYEGLTQIEIAERTGEPLGTIKTRIRLGLGKLRAMLEQTGAVE
ncbi:MAG: sigma-70 family RNA polymerase sigma factor [Chloroflexota bacterium]|nr:sigma-70 family RNA polymerase sigma factor [Chloroflexota bacterium]